MRSDSAARADAVIAGCAILFLVLLVASLRLGVYPISFAKIVAMLTFGIVRIPHAVSWTPLEQMVVVSVRLPRITLAALAGVGLGISGAAMQGIMRNPLVSPDLVGVTAGASLGGILAILLGLALPAAIALAFAGGFATFAIVVAIARLARVEGTTGFILAGVIVSAFVSSLVGFVQYSADPYAQLPEIVFWLMGSFAGATPVKVLAVAIPTAVCGSLLLAMRWRLNVLSLGDDDAQTLGLPVARLRWIIIALVSVIIASQVSVSGGVGWVGLVIPHVARMLVGAEHRRLVPVAALLGGAFLVAIDDVARSFPNQEMPVGLLTGMIGAPVFAFLFLRTQARGWANV